MPSLALDNPHGPTLGAIPPASPHSWDTTSLKPATFAQKTMGARHGVIWFAENDRDLVSHMM